ncbi:hypothetical protein GCM10022223_27260 [Kineosporia mesophila]|uniref:Uncharacterized protein n=1 Tax=Kineosporia mesophila TaxID=566012 RepID=A0ABP6ZLC7_9ACTN|nr:hypothetical protein [Kineosporia mesophila]MCD5353538.1 hypothetical protein [Kineosporia mesophila]
MTLDIDVDADGWSTLTYRHELYNDTDTPLTSMSRELWFEHTDGPLKFETLPPEDESRNIMIERKHETATTIRFACRLLPALPPGESAVVAYRCAGGRFVSDHYWRQSIVRPVDRFTLRLRHAGVNVLSSCSALEERPDGSEISATESLTWRRDDSGVAVELVRTNLRPNRAITLRWDVPRG